MQTIDYQTDPSRYRHWRIERDGDIAYLIMDVDQAGGLGDYELKLNSYDLGVDIELNDAVQRLRFEHPEVRCVVIKSGKENVFCAGANIRMLGKSTHGAKVNFCKFTNETRLAIEDASENSKQIYVCAINGNCRRRRLRAGARCRSHHAGRRPPLGGSAAGDAAARGAARAQAGSRASPTSARCGAIAPTSSARSRRGSAATKAVEWRLVDEVVPNSKWKDAVAARAQGVAARSDRPKGAKGIKLNAARA